MNSDYHHDKMTRLIIAKRAVLNFSFVVFSILVSFVIIEILLQILGFHGETFFNIENTIVVTDSILNWRHKPNSIFYSNDIVYRINEKGFRDYSYSYVKSNNTLRIFLVSDSVGFGTNVQMENSYPKILERLLNSNGSHLYVEVINYSMPGLSLKQKFHLVQLYSKDYNPDYIIIDYVVNDIEFDSRKNFESNQDTICTIELVRIRIPCIVENYLKKSAFIFFFKNAIESILYRMNIEDKNQFYEKVENDFYHELYSRQDKLELLADIIKQIGQYQNETKKRIIMPIFPLIYDYKQYKWEDINELIIKYCEANDLLYVPLLETYRNFHYNEMRVQRGDFTHPSIKGNAEAAGAILRVIRQNNLF